MDIVLSWRLFWTSQIVTVGVYYLLRQVLGRFHDLMKLPFTMYIEPPAQLVAMEQA
jgi:hypothetical protein